MIPKIHKKGSGIRGLATYVLHDKDAKTSDRVAWTETRNLATNNPEAAWRAMAATAMDRDRLKEEAGIRKSGRKAKGMFVHASLSWHPEEADGLTKDEMLRASAFLLRKLKLENQQCLIVCHDDEAQPHVHLVISRVSTEDGRLVSDSYERIKASSFAEQYERERGKIYCEQRVLNNAARARGQFTRADKERPRHIHELEASNDNRPGAQELRDKQRAKDLEVRRKELEQAKRHKAEWEAFEADHKAEKTELQAKGRREETVARSDVADQFADAWRELYHEQEAERAAFTKREETISGRASNALKSIDWRALLHHGRRGAAIMEAFGMLSSSGKRTEALRRDQQRQTLELEKRQGAAEDVAVEKVRVQNAAAMQRLRDLLPVRRAEVELRHGLEKASITAAWKERRKQRQEAWEQYERTAAAAPKLGERGIQTTKTDADAKAAAEKHMKRMREARDQRERDRRRGRDDDRGR